MGPVQRYIHTMDRKSSPGFPHVNHTAVSPFVCYAIYKYTVQYTERIYIWYIRFYNIAAGAVGDVEKKTVIWNGFIGSRGRLKYTEPGDLHPRHRFLPQKMFTDKITLSYSQHNPPPVKYEPLFLFPIFLNSYIYSNSLPIDALTLLFVCCCYFFFIFFFFLRTHFLDPSTISLIWKQMMKNPWVLPTV